MTENPRFIKFDSDSQVRDRMSKFLIKVSDPSEMEPVEFDQSYLDSGSDSHVVRIGVNKPNLECAGAAFRITILDG